MPARNLAIMFTDIKGFTARTSESTREGMVGFLAEHERLLLPVFRYFDGTIVKTIGDAFLVHFDSTTDAVLCGLAIQEVLRQHNAFADAKDRLEVRVAINAGDVELKDGDVLGEPVNIAARLEAITEAGEVYFTEAVYLSMNRKEAPSTEIGERTFKGIPQAIRVYKVIRDPNSDQAKHLAETVRLTKDGPVLRGLRAPRRVRPAWIAWAAACAAIAAAAAALILANPFKTDPVARAIAESKARMARGEHLSALEVLDVELKAKPGEGRLVETALKAAEGHLEFLLREREKKEALAWLRKAIEQRPTIEPLRKRVPALDAEVTAREVLATRRHQDQVVTELRALIDRYPTDPDVPYIAKRVLEERFIPEYCLYFYEEAIQRGKGKYDKDAHIFQILTRIFAGGPPAEHKYAHELARKHFDAERTAWARKTLDEGTTMAVLNAWAILEEKKDIAIEDPFNQALKAVVEKRGLGAACKLLQAVEDAKRGARARAVLKEVIDKGGLKPAEEEALLPAMDALIKKWGPAPAAQKDSR
jgi:class 3 adenylate cyclase